MKDITEKYIVETTEIKNGKGHWSYLQCDIILKETYDGQLNNTKIGEYKRNYRSLYHTFHPFEQNGKEYALYSKDYTSTRIMSLPDCKDLGGEGRDEWGFCPVDFYVPLPPNYYVNDDDVDISEFGTFGFVAGCVWGDDSSWKIQFLDLRNIDKGIVIRNESFGYLPMFYDRIKKSIEIDWYVDKNNEEDSEREVRIATPSVPFWFNKNFEVENN